MKILLPLAIVIGALLLLDTTTAFVVRPNQLHGRPFSTFLQSDATSGEQSGPPVKMEEPAQQQQQQTPSPGGPAAPLANADPPAATMQKSKDIWDTLPQIVVQGGALRTWSFGGASVETVQVLLKTEGRPLNSDIELWQGPDNTPQRMQVYCEDGDLRPVSLMIGTPLDSNAVAIYNTAPLEYPLIACVQASNGMESLGELTDALREYSRIVQGGAVYTCPFTPAVESVQVLMETDGRPLNARVELLQGPNNVKQVYEVRSDRILMMFGKE